MGRDNGDPMDTLKPQPGQYDSYHPKFHPLPGQWAKEQLSKEQGVPSSFQDVSQTLSGQKELLHSSQRSPMTNGSKTSTAHRTEIDRALAAERAQHNYWEEWQGVKPGKPVYEDPRAWQNTLLPTAKYGTDGR